MRLPIDTSRLKFLVVAEAEPLRQYEEGKPREAWAPRTDLNGEVLWRVQLVALGDGEAEIIRVAVPGDPKVGPGVGAGWALGDGVPRTGCSLDRRALFGRCGRKDGGIGPERCGGALQWC